MAISEEKLGKGLEKLARTLQAWQLSADGKYFLAGNSLLQPVLSESRPAMLKIPLSAKGEAGFRLLACWDGKAAVNVYKYDAHALLMERAVGTQSLRQLVLDGREDEANTIVCKVVAQLHAHTCTATPGLASLASWFRSLEKAAAQHGGLFTTCQTVADALLRDPQNQHALHGDIHYDNILDSGHSGDIHNDNIPNSGHRGWLAIDPKGVIGERAFDYANLFCNPTIEVATSPLRLPREIPLVAARVGLEPQRLLHWIIAWSGLMAAWMLEDAEVPTLPLLVAELAMKELQTS
jgi:streptomycin 6-kinase